MTNAEFFSGISCFKCESQGNFTRLWKANQYSWMCECLECGFRFRRSYKEAAKGIINDMTYEIYNPLRKVYCRASDATSDRFKRVLPNGRAGR